MLGAEDQEVRRTLGLVLLRGEYILTIIPEGAPTKKVIQMVHEVKFIL
jgi:hypothetical protein